SSSFTRAPGGSVTMRSVRVGIGFGGGGGAATTGGADAVCAAGPAGEAPAATSRSPRDWRRTAAPTPIARTAKAATNAGDLLDGGGGLSDATLACTLIAACGPDPLLSQAIGP